MRECSTPRQWNNLPFKPDNQNQNQNGGQNLNSQQGEETHPSNPLPVMININRKLRQVGVSNGPEYYNPNPWVRILGRANKTEIEVDGKISKALIR